MLVPKKISIPQKWGELSPYVLIWKFESALHIDTKYIKNSNPQISIPQNIFNFAPGLNFEAKLGECFQFYLDHTLQKLKMLKRALQQSKSTPIPVGYRQLSIKKPGCKKPHTYIECTRIIHSKHGDFPCCYSKRKR